MKTACITHHIKAVTEMDMNYDDNGSFSSEMMS